jgi:hypothetical protein
LYYNGNGRLLVFYDKIADYKHKHLPVPQMYQNRNVLRYEMRFTKRLLKQFNLPQFSAEKLFEEQFYMDIVSRWHKAYQDIDKVRNINNIDFNMIKTVEQLKLHGVSLLIKEQGGELEFLSKLDEAQKKGELSKKQKGDIKKLVEKASNCDLLTCESDIITELDKKIKEAVKYYV